MLNEELLSVVISLYFPGFIIEYDLAEVAKDVTEVCLVKRKRKSGLTDQSSPIHVVYILDWTKLCLYPSVFFFLPEKILRKQLESFKTRTCQKHLTKITGYPLLKDYFCHTDHCA